MHPSVVNLFGVLLDLETQNRGDFVIQHNLTHWLRYGGIRDGAKQLFEGEGGLN